jgi:hypothetical protein
MLASGSGQAASKSDITVSVTRGSAPGMLDFQIADQSFPGLSSLRFVLFGVPITSITCPSGWTSQVSPTSGAVCGGGSLGPGQTLAGSFIYGGSQPPTAGTLFVGNASGTEQIPFTIAGGTPSPCKCVKLKASIVPASIDVTVHELAQIKFKVRWTLTCSGGSGTGCEADLYIFPRAEGGWVPRDDSPYNIHVRCTGPCAGSHTGKKEVDLHLVGVTRDDLAGKTLLVSTQTACGQLPGKQPETEHLSIKFDHVGRPDRKHSTLH